VDPDEKCGRKAEMTRGTSKSKNRMPKLGDEGESKNYSRGRLESPRQEREVIWGVSVLTPANCKCLVRTGCGKPTTIEVSRCPLVKRGIGRSVFTARTNGCGGTRSVAGRYRGEPGKTASAR